MGTHWRKAKEDNTNSLMMEKIKLGLKGCFSLSFFITQISAMKFQNLDQEMELFPVFQRAVWLPKAESFRVHPPLDVIKK